MLRHVCVLTYFVSSLWLQHCSEQCQPVQLHARPSPPWPRSGVVTSDWRSWPWSDIGVKVVPVTAACIRSAVFHPLVAVSVHNGAACVSASCSRPSCADRYRSKKKAFTKAAMKWTDDAGKKEIEKDFAKLKRYCSIIRVIAHTQVLVHCQQRCCWWWWQDECAAGKHPQPMFWLGC